MIMKAKKVSHIRNVLMELRNGISSPRVLMPSDIDRATEIIQGNKDKFVRLAELLYEKEVIFAEDIESVLGPKVKPDTGADQTVPDASGDGLGAGQEGGEPEAGETVTEK